MNPKYQCHKLVCYRYTIAAIILLRHGYISSTDAPPVADSASVATSAKGAAMDGKKALVDRTEDKSYSK